MKPKHISVAVLLFALLTLPSWAQKYAFETLPHADKGRTFYALDTTTGQLHYMNDLGTGAGQWKKFGHPIRKSGNGRFQLRVAKEKDGVVFYSLNGANGAVHFMRDYGPRRGKWKRYGGTLGSP